MSAADAKLVINNHVEQMLARLPGAHQDATLLRGWLSIYGDRTQVLENVIRDINTATLFDIDTAVGINLDQIGSIIEMPRDGRDDTAYRIVIRAQSQLILPERRTQRNLMKVVRTLLDTPAGNIAYSQASPKSFRLVVPSATLAQLISWVPILRRTRPATYSALLFWTTLGHLTFQDASGTIPVPGANVSGFSDASGTVSLAWGGYGAVIDF